MDRYKITPDKRIVYAPNSFGGAFRGGVVYMFHDSRNIFVVNQERNSSLRPSENIDFRVIK